MSLSTNLKRFRQEKGLTQEQLAGALGVSPQAVSKWETSETYPDGDLLVPLAAQLGVSLDTLLGNPAVSMADIARRIIQLIGQTPAEARFQLARDIGWQIERGLFDCWFKLDEPYRPDALQGMHNASNIVDDHGFTFISNGRAPFFSVFPEPDGGFGEVLADGEALRAIFACLASPETMRAILYLHRQEKNYIFERAVLARECQLEDDAVDRVLHDLLALRLLSVCELPINGVPHTLYASRPSHKLIALLVVARELQYDGAYSLQADHRTKPYL